MLLSSVTVTHIEKEAIARDNKEEDNVLGIKKDKKQDNKENKYKKQTKYKLKCKEEHQINKRRVNQIFVTKI